MRGRCRRRRIHPSTSTYTPTLRAREEVRPPRLPLTVECSSSSTGTVAPNTPMPSVTRSPSSDTVSTLPANRMKPLLDWASRWPEVVIQTVQRIVAILIVFPDTKRRMRSFIELTVNSRILSPIEPSESSLCRPDLHLPAPAHEDLRIQEVTSQTVLDAGRPPVIPAMGFLDVEFFDVFLYRKKKGEASASPLFTK